MFEIRVIHLATAHNILCRYTYFEKQCLRGTERENFDLITCNCGICKRVSNLGNMKAVELNNCTLSKANDYSGIAAATSTTDTNINNNTTNNNYDSNNCKLFLIS